MVAKRKKADAPEQVTLGWEDSQNAQIGEAVLATQDTGGWGDAPVEGQHSGDAPAEEVAAEPQQEPVAEPAKRSRRGKAQANPAALEDDEAAVNLSNVKKSLIDYVERFERMAEERQAISDDIGDLVREVKTVGFNTKIFREVLRRRKLDPEAVKEHDSLLALYEEAVR